jgi:hypothetical protein
MVYIDALGLSFSCYSLLILLLCGSHYCQDGLSRGRLLVRQSVLHSLLLLKTNLHSSWHAYPLEHDLMYIKVAQCGGYPSKLQRGMGTVHFQCPTYLLHLGLFRIR